MLNLVRMFDRDENVVEVAAGEPIFETGEQGRYMFVVVEGRVDIVLDDKVVETVEPGGIFGEMALIDKSPRSASAVAHDDCRLAKVDERRFTFLVQETPYFALDVMSIMASRLRRQSV